MLATEPKAKSVPPKDGLVRAARPGLAVLRAVPGSREGKMPKLTGYMLRFNEWTEIDSCFEGNFLERIAPGATKKTLAENKSMRILFNHGHDPQVGEKPLAEPRFVEDDQGVRYDDPELFDTSYNRDLIPGLEKGQYGSSFKFRSIKELFDEDPGVSDHNPKGIPERTIEEIALYEGGPVVFPAYEGSSAGARSRSLTDHLYVERLKSDPSRFHELDELFQGWVHSDPERVRELLRESPSAEAPAEETGTEDPEKEAAGRAEETHSEQSENPEDETSNPDEDALSDGAEPESHSENESRTNATTTQPDEDTEWWNSLGDEDEKEWRLP